jgi:hypothetical protein
MNYYELMCDESSELDGVCVLKFIIILLLRFLELMMI